MIRYGDRRNRPDSRRVEDEHQPLVPRDDHVMRVLVLSDDILDDARRLLHAEPIENRVKRVEVTQREAKARQIAAGDITNRLDIETARRHISA